MKILRKIDGNFTENLVNYASKNWNKFCSEFVENFADRMGKQLSVTRYFNEIVYLPGI